MAEGPASKGDLLGVVTVLFGGDEVVEGFFDSLSLQRDVRHKVYVIDNNPTPALTERCRALAAARGIEVECVHTGENVGVARGNNMGIERARRDGCRHVLLANNDTVFDEHTFGHLQKAMRQGELAATPKLLLPGPERRIWFVSGQPDAWTSPTRHVGEGEPDRGQYDHLVHTDYAPTTFLMLDVSVFDRVGVMDETFFAYYDDTDFVKRMRTAGVRIRCCPDAEVVHLVGTSTGGTISPFTVYQSHRNRIYFMRKHFRGLERAVGLGTFLIMRIPRTFTLSPGLSRRMWMGVWAGLRLPIPRSG